MLHSVIFVLVVPLFLSARAQQVVWQQCGGTGWKGPTNCQNGSACVKQNDWYSQCLPMPSPSPTPAPPNSSNVNYWFSFGDSYTQTGFNATNGVLPTVGNPLGNPTYPGFTAVGGTNWIDVVTVQFNKSVVLTWNFAYGGATIDASLVLPFEPTVLSLKDQVELFSSTAGAKPGPARWTSANALFSFWIGINDIGNSYYLSGDRSAFSDTLLNAYFNLVSKIYALGGRNFLFINVPPIDRSPLMLSQPTSAQFSEATVIAEFNSKLESKIAAFSSANSGVLTWLWDSNNAFTTILNDPGANGFVDATSYGESDDFWGNNYHPSSAAHTIFGRQIGALLNNTFW